ncbi:hypothetical protein LTR37_011346 [Vermiconidia calcicola]|uniref:Uncharacterized protein n=1 Tax=Vermiconidia calcicola TaxID=1690605 RepID=A0ACC3N2E2_9PEZI|nr:hypothetical protein LTR37_011346 [Vermiconidia calcicola]
MSTTKQPARSDGTTADADVILNRINVALARSQRLVNSWLPPKLEEPDARQDTDDEDFRSMTETGGIGSRTAYDDDQELPDGLAPQRKKLGVNDKLLEQILGKKAAQAKRKERDAGKGMSASKHAAPKPLVARPKDDHRKGAESDDEEEGGRAATFRSRRPGKVTKEKESPRTLSVDESVVIDAGPNAAHERVRDWETTSAMASEPDEKPAKRKAGSYLDEVLAQSAKKRKKKKHKSVAVS